MEIALKGLMMTEKLNFLLGSGTSVPGIPLMSQVESNEDLLETIRKRTNRLLQIDFLNPKKTEDCPNDKDLITTQETYIKFIKTIIDILYSANSREVPKGVNIFTTNYDLFLENAIDYMMKSELFVFNDGARGYFDRELDSSNFNQVVSYRGLNDNYINEIPSITLIKPHGSVNWEERETRLLVRNEVVETPAVVLPDHNEEERTFMNNHFHEMLRVFQLELDKPQSVLIVIGFSFQDQHIAKMVRRALGNKELVVICFCYDDNDEKKILKNLDYIDSFPNNLKIKKPGDILKSNNKKTFVLSDLINLLSSMALEGECNDES